MLAVEILGVPSNMSPIKKSWKNSEYFTAVVGDCKKKITLWGYHEKQMEQLKG